MYRPRVVANALLKKAASSGSKLTCLKLQKLVFFMHAWNLALNGQALVDESPEAWPYGPVFPSLYQELKSFGSSVVDSYIEEMDIPSGKFVAFTPNPADQSFYSLLDRVWERYGNLTAGQLSGLSHVDDGPWDQARHQELRSVPPNMIQEFYRSQLPNANT